MTDWDNIVAKWLREESGYEDMRMHLWNGTRTKDVKKLMTNGYCSPNIVESKRLILNALRYLGKEKIVTVKGDKGDAIRRILWSVQQPHRMKIWATGSGKESACSWANSGPESVVLALDRVGISRREILDYVLATFGEPVAIKLKHRVPMMKTGPNVNTGIRCLEGSDIEEIIECDITIPFTSWTLTKEQRKIRDKIHASDMEDETRKKLPSHLKPKD